MRSRKHHVRKPDSDIPQVKRPAARSETQSRRRSFLCGRNAILKKVSELNKKTGATLGLVGSFEGERFCYEERLETLMSFGVKDDLSDRFGPDHVELVSERKATSQKTSHENPVFSQLSSISAPNKTSPSMTTTTVEQTSSHADATQLRRHILPSRYDISQLVNFFSIE